MNARTRELLLGCSYMLAAAVSWGGMFPVAKATLHYVDAFYLTSLRYGTTMLIMVAVLALSEGRAALRPEGRALPALLFGTAGFSGFGLFVFTGLRHSTPAHGAILVALLPLLTALVTGLISRSWPPRHTLLSIVLALVGVALVVSDGHPATVFESRSAGADLQILLGVLSWVIYTLGARRFPGWSPLRYTTVTVIFGVPSILFFTLLATLTGHATLPTAHALGQVVPHFVYIVVCASVIGVLGWNAGVRKLGSVNGVLFINFVPISAFLIQAAQGAALSGWELAGGALVMLALLQNNLMQRSATTPQPARPQPRPLAATRGKPCSA